MNKDKIIDVINKVLKDNFDYVPLDTTIKVTDSLIEEGVIKIEEETEHNLRVCDHCLAAIQSREGYLPTLTLHINEEDPVESKCEWCEEEGFDVLYELI